MSRYARFAISSMVVGLAFAGSSCGWVQTARVFDFQDSELSEIQVDIDNSTPTTYETRNCSAGADPVMHMFTNTGSDERIPIAFDDNGAGGVNARITVPHVNAGIAFILLRAQGEARGTCDIWRRSLPWRFSVPVGGKMVFISTKTGDAVETVSMPHGASNQVLYRMMGTGIVQKITSGGTGGSVRTILPAPSAQYLVGSNGPSRLVVNDFATDSDDDGLGDKLEAALGTCSARNTYASDFDCNLPATTQDTDGDGLSDFWEVLGKRDAMPHQLLPLWGADPRHKDLFVEVDFRGDGRPPVRLAPDQALIAATFFQDTAEVSIPLIQLYRGTVLLANPDQKPGVNLHLDTGVGPLLPADETVYGNWGGYSVLDANVDNDGWQTQMAVARRGVFRWIIGLRSLGASTTLGTITSVVGINNPDSGETIAHELGHGMGLLHDGADSAGIMNAKPQYASIMNYAYSYTGTPRLAGFTDGLAPGQMNNVSLHEFGALAGAPDKERYALRYEKVFQYFVDHSTWSVDFDRDGLIAPILVRVKAYANSGPGLQSEGVRHRRNVLLDAANASSHGAALARHNSRILLLTATESGIMLQSAPDTLAGCIQGGGESGENPCTVFTSPSVLFDQAVRSVAAVTIGGRVQVVFVDAANVLRSAILTVTTTGLGTFTLGQTIATGVVDEPALLAPTTATGLVVFKRLGNVLFESRRASNGVWRPPVAAQGPLGQTFTVSDAPGLGFGSMPGDDVSFTYLHSTNSIAGSVMMRRDDILNRWNVTTFPTSVSVTRPSLAYVPGNLVTTRGRFYALTTNIAGVPRMRSSGYHLVGSTNVNDFGLTDVYDNGDLKVFGVALMFQLGFDSNLRAVLTPSFGIENTHPTFEPLADGIVDRPYRSFNDWKQIGQALCRSVSNPGGLVTHPIACL